MKVTMILGFRGWHLIPGYFVIKDDPIDRVCPSIWYGLSIIPGIWIVVKKYA